MIRESPDNFVWVEFFEKFVDNPRHHCGDCYRENICEVGDLSKSEHLLSMLSMRNSQAIEDNFPSSGRSKIWTLKQAPIFTYACTRTHFP